MVLVLVNNNNPVLLSVSFHLNPFLIGDDSVFECQIYSWLQHALKQARSGPEDFRPAL